jgi:ADP-heptose:LPS heptosyltransferase
VNILVVSILRLGDVLLCAPAIAGVRKKYPEANIHILINKNSRSVTSLLPGIKEVYEIDRDGLQDSLVTRDRSFIEPYDRIHGLTELINSKRFDLVLNLTHTRMSGWLMNLIDAKKKLGLEMQADGRPVFGSPWFQFLNDGGSQQSEHSFHYSDIYAYGCGVRSPERRMELQETEKGRGEADRLLMNIQQLICVQAFTSDAKKTWPIQKWKRTIELIADVEREASFGILCSPTEVESAFALVKQLKAKLIDAHVLQCSLEGAHSILKRSRLLITGDTSIKHIGAGSGVPIVEVSVGSSSFERTGAYTDQVVILQAKQECAPCVHSGTCPYPSPACHDKISAEAVALAAQTVLHRRWQDLKIVAQEFSDTTAFLKGDFSWESEWRAVPLAQSFQSQLALEWIDRASQKLFLNGASEEIMSFGSEGVQVRRLFSEAYPYSQANERIEVYRQIEGDLKRLKSDLDSLSAELKILIKNFANEEAANALRQRLNRVVLSFRQISGFDSYTNRLSELEEELAAPTSLFVQIKKAREVITAQVQRLEIEVRLIATLRNQELETI